MSLWNPLGRRRGNKLLDLIRADSRATKIVTAAIRRADLSVCDENGNSALHLAAERGQLRTVRLLLDAGAIADIRNAAGLTPYDLAPRNVADTIRSHIESAGGSVPPRSEVRVDAPVADEPEEWPPELLATLAAAPCGFFEDSDSPIMIELGIGNLFAIQRGVQIAMDNLGRGDLTDSLLTSLGAHIGTGLDPSIATQIQGNLPRYAAAFGAARESGSDTVEATMSAIVWTFDDFLRRFGAPEDQSIELVTIMTQSCTDVVKLAVNIIDDHYDDRPEQPEVAYGPEVSPELSAWLQEKLQNPDTTDTEKLELILRHVDGARDFLRVATGAGFVVEGEDDLGLTLVGANSRIILTVLGSRGIDKIWTLSIKEGDRPVVTLVDEGELRPVEVTLVHEDAGVSSQQDERGDSPALSGTNPLSLAVLANDSDAVGQLLEAGWAECEEVKDGSLHALAKDKGFDDIAIQLEPHLPGR